MRPSHTVRIAALALVTGTPSLGQPLSIEYLGGFELASGTQDQFGAAASVGGLSGVTHVADDVWLAVRDNSDVVVRLRTVQDSSGAVTDVFVDGALRVGLVRDHEGIAIDETETLWLSEEGGPSIHAFDLTTGSPLGGPSSPSVFSHRRNNRGFESLAIGPGVMWTANEESLTVDGPASSPGSPTLVRLQRFDHGTMDPVASAQYALAVEPMHGVYIPFTGDGQSGLCDLIALPDGRLLALERSLAFSTSLYLTRVFALTTCAGQDVGGFASLDDPDVIPLTKHPIYSASHANLEGIGLGPAFDDGSHLMLGVVDDGDPLSSNRVEVFRLSGRILPIADWNGDGIVNTGDFIGYLNDYNTAQAGGTPVFGSPDLAAPSGTVNTADFLAFLNAFVAGCG